MPEHRIRFRGGWESQSPGLASRLSLPIRWPPGIEGPIRLIRRFGRPPIDPALESAGLELRRVPGLASLGLNGVDLGVPPAGLDGWTVPVTDALEARNTLILEINPGDSEHARDPEGWGWIALVIGPRS